MSPPFIDVSSLKADCKLPWQGAPQLSHALSCQNDTFCLLFSICPIIPHLTTVKLSWPKQEAYMLKYIFGKESLQTQGIDFNTFVFPSQWDFMFKSYFQIYRAPVKYTYGKSRQIQMPCEVIVNAISETNLYFQLVTLCHNKYLLNILRLCCQAYFFAYMEKMKSWPVV